MNANIAPVPIPDDELAYLRQTAIHELVDIPGSTATIRPEFEPGEMLWLLDQVDEARALREALKRTDSLFPSYPDHEATSDCCVVCGRECHTVWPACGAGTEVNDAGPR